jgi:hypothetical protein
MLLSELERSFECNVFIMMRYRTTERFRDIETTLRQTLSTYGLIARLAKDAALSEDMWENLQYYMKYSRFGIAVFEAIEEHEFNPNISLELGYMYGLNRRCLLLKDRRMPRLPTDTCGKIYSDFDTQQIPDSLAKQVSDWCSRDLGLSKSSERESTQKFGVVIFDGDVEDSEFKTWGWYDTSLMFERHIRLLSIASCDGGPGVLYAVEISATGSENVGINKKIPTLFGRARFMYKALTSAAKVINLYFAMIPMQKEELGSVLLEVGAYHDDDPDNAYSPYRKRYYIPDAHVGDGGWHEAEMDFDFRDVPNASYSILAARINEGCPKPGGGKLLIRGIKVAAYDEPITMRARRPSPT